MQLYGAGRFWDSHEALEGAWRSSGSNFYQGLILYASAWVHWERANAHGVQAQLRKTAERLSAYPEVYLGLDVSALRQHCLSVCMTLSRDPDGWQNQVAPAAIHFSSDRVRGDEVELADANVAG